MTATASEMATYLDALLDAPSIPDYAGAMNGLQLANRGPVRRVGAAVDFSLRVIEESIRRDVNLLIVHHGMFWGGVRPLVGVTYDRLRLLIAHDIAVYASHLPLDAHASLGNAVLLAQVLDLRPSLPFAHYEGCAVGVAGECDVETADLLSRADRFARGYGGGARGTACEIGRRSRRWALCTGAGASTATLQEAEELGIDTLIVGEGAHHTAVHAPEQGLVIVYAGHYATETLGVRAAAERLSDRFTVPWEFIHSPTGL